MKKILSCILILALVLSMVACGGSKYAGVYTCNVLGMDLKIILDNKGNFGMYASGLYSDEEEVKALGLGETFGVILGTYVEGDNNNIYFNADTGTDDLGFQLVSAIYTGVLSGGGRYDKSAKALIISYSGLEVTFLKSDEKVPKMYTADEVIKASNKATEKANQDTSKNDNNQVSAQELVSGIVGGITDMANEIANEIIQQDQNTQQEAQVQQQVVQQEEKDNAYYIARLLGVEDNQEFRSVLEAEICASDGSYDYWSYDYCGMHGTLKQSRTRPEVIDYAYGDESILIEAYYAANGYRYFEFQCIYRGQSTVVNYRGDSYEGYLLYLYDNNGVSTEYTVTELPLDDDPEFTETVILKEGQPWISFDWVEGYPYEDYREM